MRSVAVCLLTGLLVAGGSALAPGAAAEPVPADACNQVSNPGRMGGAGSPASSEPWAQHLFAFQRAWPFSRGKGITVGVVDSGVDNDVPTLSQPGKVLPGSDFIRKKGNADFDCVGHGTAVSSIIAGGADPTVAFRGVAPDAHILPVRVSDLAGNGTDAQRSDQSAGLKDQPVTPEDFAKAIRYAVDQGIQVLNLSVTVGNIPAVQEAIQYAQDHDVVVVAAAGNSHPTNDSTQNAKPVQADQAKYPAAYPGVVGVGAISQDGTVLAESQRGSFVDIVAPGDSVLAATRGGGYASWTGTSFATPFVSGTVALIRAEFPQLNAQQVIHRLLATADPAPGNTRDISYGVGVVDPVRAVTENLGDANPPAKRSAATLPLPDYAGQRRAALVAARASHANRTMLLLAGGGAVVALLVVTIANGRRRRWVPGRVELS